MNKKILSCTIATLLSMNAMSETYFSIITPEKGSSNYVTTPTISLGETTILEADEDKIINIPLILSNELPTDTSIDYILSHISTTDLDVEINSGTINISRGASTASIPVNIKGDYIIENDENFKITLSNPKFAILSEINKTKTYTITDNDTVPSVSVQDLIVTESTQDSVEYITVTLSKPSGIPFSVDYSTSLDTASNNDVELTSGTLNFNEGEISKTFPITIKEDTIDEENEIVKIHLSNPKDVNIDKSEADLIIQDNDDSPIVTAINKVQFEGDEDSNVAIQLQLSEASERNISLNYELLDGTTDSTDYVKTTGTINFLAGTTEQDLEINVLGDYTMEENETIDVILSNPSNVVISESNFEVILDNDDTEYEFNTLPIYGKVQYQNEDDSWSDVIANYGYERDIKFRYNPTESEVLAVSKDVGVGSFDTEPSSPGSIEGEHDLSEWGTTSGNTSNYTDNGVTIKTVLSNGNIIFNPNHIGIGSDAHNKEISSPTKFTVTLTGDFLNDVEITAASLGTCFELAATCETKVSIDAYDEDNNLLSSQGGYRQSGLLVDNYYFTGETPIKKFKIYPTPTNEGGNNSSLSSGNFVLSNITVSRSAFEVIDYKYTDIDGTISTETINLNINEGNANTNVDLNQYLLGQ